MHRSYLAIVGAGRRLSAAARIPVPGPLRRLNRAIRRALSNDVRSDREVEIAALARGLERLETMAYVDRIGRRPD